MSYPPSVLAAKTSGDSDPQPKKYHRYRISSNGFTAVVSVSPSATQPSRPSSLSQAAFTRPLPTAFSPKKKRSVSSTRLDPDLPAVEIACEELDQEQQNVNVRKRRSPTEKMEVLSGNGLKPLPLSPSKLNVRTNCLFKQARTSLENTFCTNHHGDDTDEEVEEVEDYIPVESYSASEFVQFRRRKLDVDAELKKDQEDLFQILPDEMVLKVFSFLPKVTLGRCAMVSSRFNRLATDESLWKRVDQLGKIVSGDSLATMMSRKPVYFRLARSAVSLLPSTFTVSQSQLMYLDLSMVEISQEALTAILKRCNKLTKLSLEHLVVGKEALVALAACRDLHTLNLAMCYDLDSGALVNVFLKNVNIKELNLGCVKQSWSREELFKIIFALPTGMTNLNFSGFRGALLDAHIQLMVTRIPHVIDLDLSDSQELTSASILTIASRLTRVEHLAFSRCYSIEPPVYTALAHIPTLRYLELFSLFKEPSLKTLGNAMPGIHINHFPFSSTARPTVGAKRSSIWGQRVRD